MSIQFVPKIPNTYICELCDYVTSNKKDYNKHIMTRKHQCATKPQQNDNQNILYICEHCKKEYRDRSGLWRHKQKCGPNENKIIESKQTTTTIDPIDHASLTEKMIELVMSKNQEFMNVFMEKIVHLLPSINGNHNSITTNNNNNQFNIQMFLNEVCRRLIETTPEETTNNETAHTETDSPPT